MTYCAFMALNRKVTNWPACRLITPRSAFISHSETLTSELKVVGSIPEFFGEALCKQSIYRSQSSQRGFLMLISSNGKGGAQQTLAAAVPVIKGTFRFHR